MDDYHTHQIDRRSPRSPLAHLVVAATLSLLFLPGCGNEPAPEKGKQLPAPTQQVKPVEVSGKKEHRPAITLTSPAPGDLLSGESFTISGEGLPLDSALHFRLVYDSVLTLVSGDLPMPSSDSVPPRGSFSRKVTWNSDWEGEAVLEVFEIDTLSGKELGHRRVSVLLPPVPEGDSVRTVYAYFPNRRIGSRADCGLVFPLVRHLPGRSRSLARGAIYYMLKGVRPDERKEGYFESIPRGLRLDQIQMENGVARLDFSRHLNQSRRSCQSETIRAQIEQTVAQFMSVDAVVIRVNGRVWTAGRP